MASSASLTFCLTGIYKQNLTRINRRPNMRELHPELQYFCSTAERFKEELGQLGDWGVFSDPVHDDFRCPLVIYHSYGKIHHLLGKFAISMVIFNSYFEVTRG